MSNEQGKFQARKGGSISYFHDLEEALLQEFDKISWTVGEHSRLILWADGTWEYRTPEAFRKQVME
jgi:hypothetical protein